jgi:regulation of enolase protein 1 (concanavalin A-like superfamily)
VKKYIPLSLSIIFICAMFTNGQNGDQMSWLNQPKTWSYNGGKITIVVESKTDFWRVTHYGYVTDNGHFYFREQEGDFTAQVKIQGDYKSLYDQAGLMIRVDERNWIKAGVEFVNDRENISTVMTRDYSDWSVVPQLARPKQVWLKLIRKNDYVEISYSLDNKSYNVVREGYFPPRVKCEIGVMAAAPEGHGFQAIFEEFRITPES